MASTSKQSNMHESLQLPQEPEARKLEISGLSRLMKLKALSVYCKCRHGRCACHGFKKDQHHDTGKSVESIDEVCACGHKISAHFSDYQYASEEDLNFFVIIVTDIRYLAWLCKEKNDPEKYQVCYAFGKKLAKCVQDKKRPSMSMDFLENPPFEKPSIAEAITNFVEFKCSSLTNSKYEAMLDISKLFIKRVNCLKLPSVKEFEDTISKNKNLKFPEGISQYKAYYIRWLQFCYVPGTCNSLQAHVTTDIFGQNFLRFIYDTSQELLLNKLEFERDKVPVNKQPMINVTNNKMFLASFREEVFSNDSSIWSIDFKGKQKEQGSFTSSLAKQSIGTLSAKYSSTGPKASPNKDSEQGASTSSLSKQSIGNLNDKYSSTGNKDSGDVPMDVVVETVRAIKDTWQMVRPENTEFYGKTYIQCMEQERNGTLESYIIANSLQRKVSDQCLLWLIALQNLISKCLIKMPKDHITRLLFDPKHKSIVLFKNKVLAGGICFCMFPTQGFSEIVFCVVSEKEQSKGYGEYMMNKVKDYHIKHNILHLLTFADDGAIGFFEKQGFVADMKFEESRYHGYIKDYVHSKFMHCELNPRIVYSQFLPVIQMQKEIVKTLVQRKQKEEPIVYKGLDYFKTGVREIPCDVIPGLKEAGFRGFERPRNEMSSDHLRVALKNLLIDVKEHDCSWPFQKTSDEVSASEHGRYPMDLTIMADRLKKNYYCSKHLFIADMLRIFNNCRSSKKATSRPYKCADALEQFFRKRLKEYNL